MIDFPANPTIGDVLPPQAPSPFAYYWDGTVWIVFEGTVIPPAPAGLGGYEFQQEIVLSTNTDTTVDTSFALDPNFDYEFQFIGTRGFVNQDRLIAQLSPNGTNWDVLNDYTSQNWGCDSSTYYARPNTASSCYMSDLQQNAIGSGSSLRPPATVSAYVLNHNEANQPTVVFGSFISYGQQGSTFTQGIYNSFLNQSRVDQGIRFGFGQVSGTNIPDRFITGLLRVYSRRRA